MFPGQLEIQPELLPVQVLAYLGDAVYELFVRHYLVVSGVSRPVAIHNEAVKYVRADFQAGVMRRLEKELSEEEKAIARRGRNAKLSRPPKGQTLPENYHYSTAFEALIGFLYLKGEKQRLLELMSSIFRQDGGIS
jgi:ribonuclease-3 family protein